MMYQTQQVPEPQFKGIKMTLNKAYWNWLNQETEAIVYLEDRGQKLREIHLHKSGEIIHVKRHELAPTYKGAFIDMNHLRVGEHLRIYHTNESMNQSGAWAKLKFVPVRLEFPNRGYKENLL